MIDPQLTEIGLKVLRKRYLIRDESGEVIETPRQRYERVARFIATAEGAYGGDPNEVWPVFYDLMARGDFLPNSPCIANAGREGGTGHLSACHVVEVPDSIEGIFDALKEQALLQKGGGGTGMSFSRLRPEGDFVKTTSGVASGPVSFLQIFDEATQQMKQGGTRRGANMAILRVDHPDILKFIDCKVDKTKVTNFNISVAITDAFMEALNKNDAYELIHPRTGEVVKHLRARDVWEQIILNAHANGEPGLFFIDRTNAADPLVGALGEIESTNPCGEQALRPDDSCTLGSINLSNFHIGQCWQGALYGQIDWDRLRGVIHNAVRFLDNVLDLNNYPLKKIRDKTLAGRKIGLGVMGWADLLIKLGVPYEREMARKIAGEVMGFVNHMAIRASERLAEERGAFPLWKQSTLADQGKKPRRNFNVTTVAPTGTISILAGCSSGIEPLFSLCMTRRQADMEMVDFNPLLRQVGEREGFWSSELETHVAEHGSLQGYPGQLLAQWRDVFKTANELSMEAHVKMQAAFQEHVDSSISKTCNLHRDAPRERVEEAYELAWKLGCKGITVYRDGSRDAQTLSVGAKTIPVGAETISIGTISGRASYKEYQQQNAPKADNGHPQRRHIPDDGWREGVTITKRTAYGSVHVTITRYPETGEPFEIFIDMGKSGSELRAFIEALGRTASLLLKVAPDPRQALQDLGEQLVRISGGEVQRNGSETIVSAPDGVAHAIRDYLAGGGSIERTPEGDGRRAGELCPDCGSSSLYYAEGCLTCHSCAFSRC